MIRYIAIPGSNFNSVHLSVPCFSTPHFITSMLGGCDSLMKDQCPIDTAMACAVIQLLKENIIQILSHKLMQVKLTYYI